MNLKSNQAHICLWYALLVASACNVLQWQHHRQCTNALNAEIARLHARNNAIYANLGYFKTGTVNLTNLGNAGTVSNFVREYIRHNNLKK